MFRYFIYLPTTVLTITLADTAERKQCAGNADESAAYFLAG